MLSDINRFIVACSSSWWKFGLILAGQLITLRVLSSIDADFPTFSGGHPVFDMQNNLTSAQIFSQLQTWEHAAYESYYLFTFIDYAFPLFAGLVVGAVAAFGLRHARPDWYEAFLKRRLFVLFLVPTAFDYLENLTLITVILGHPEEFSAVAKAAIGAKKCKLATTAFSIAVALILLVWGSGRLAVSSVRARLQS